MYSEKDFPRTTREKHKAVNKEIKLNEDDVLITKTDKSGRIEECNDNFLKISQYTRDEAIGEPHNIVRHPDMPKAIFYYMWKTINSGRNFTGLVKNLAKDGKYYWVVTDFDIQKDEMGKSTGFIAYRSKAKHQAIKLIELIYAEMKEIEWREDMEASYNFLLELLTEQGVTYNEFIEKVVKGEITTETLQGKITPPTPLQRIGKFLS